MNFSSHIPLYMRNNVLCMDNSSLGTYMECPRKFLYRCILSLKSPMEKPAITFGTAFHSALEAYYSGKPFEDCLFEFGKEAMKERSKISITMDAGTDIGQLGEYSLQFGHLLLKKYVDMHPLEHETFDIIRNDNGDYYLEQGFAIDLPHGILIGKIDGMGTKRVNKRKLVLENKTTKQCLNTTYLSGFNPNTQVSAYLYAAAIFLGELPECAIINAIRVKDYKRGDPEKNDEKLFVRIETKRTEQQLEQHIQHVNFLMSNVLVSIEHGLDGFPQHAPFSCNTKFGECEYKPLCMCDNEVMIERLAETAFVTQVFEPYEVFENVKKIIEIDTTRDNKVDVREKEEFIA